MGDPKKATGPHEGRRPAKHKPAYTPAQPKKPSRPKQPVRATKAAHKPARPKKPARAMKRAPKRILKAPRHVETLEAVRSGLQPQALNALVERGYARSELVRLVGPRSTIERKLSGNIRLDLPESDRLARLSRIIAKAEAVFGNIEKARHWMERPSSQLPGGESPLSLLDTDGGTQVVTERLLQIEYGVFA